MDQEIDQDPPGFDGESIPVSSNQETEQVPVQTYQEKDDFWGNGFYSNVKENGNMSSLTPEETDLNQLPGIPPVSSGQGLPFAPVDFPSPGDVWTWRVGRRVNNTGFHKERFLILPERLKAKNAPKSFASKNTLSCYLESNFPDMDVNAFFASFSWNIPALFHPANRVDAGSLFEGTSEEGQNQDENAEDGKKEGTTSCYSEIKRKPMQTHTYESVEEKPKTTLLASNRIQIEKEVTKTSGTKHKSSLESSKRSTRPQQGGMVDLTEEEKEPDAKKTGRKMRKGRGNFVDEEEDVSIPNMYVSPTNGVLAVSHSPEEINPEEFDSYLNTMENLLQQEPSEAGQESSSFPVTASSPMRKYEWADESRFGFKRDWVEGKRDCLLGKSREWKESKKHRLYDDDEDSEDELLAMRTRRSFDDSGVNVNKKTDLGYASFGIDSEYGTGSSSKDLVGEKRRKPYLDGSRNVGFPNQIYKKRCKVSGDESKTHALLLHKKHKRALSFDGPIRVQGKNGVLKVMVKKQNKMGGLLQNLADAEAGPTQYASKIQDSGKIRVAIQSPTTTKSESMAKMLPPLRIESNGLKMPTNLTMKSKGQDQDSEDSGTSRRLQKRLIQPNKPLQMSSVGGEKTLPEMSMPSKIRDGKIRRGSGTEKQRLRERIREMLLEAGWTIDYRPRRNRDYLDAVYISPKGTAYWSIIKAYEALLKQVNKGEKVSKPCEDSSSFTLISDEILSQLTRKTKRKMENDMKMQEQSASDSDEKPTFGLSGCLNF